MPKQKAGTTYYIYIISLSSPIIQLSSVLDKFHGSSKRDERKAKRGKQEAGNN